MLTMAIGSLRFHWQTRCSPRCCCLASSSSPPRYLSTIAFATSLSQLMCTSFDGGGGAGIAGDGAPVGFGAGLSPAVFAPSSLLPHAHSAIETTATTKRLMRAAYYGANPAKLTSFLPTWTVSGKAWRSAPRPAVTPGPRSAPGAVPPPAPPPPAPPRGAPVAVPRPAATPPRPVHH